MSNPEQRFTEKQKVAALLVSVALVTGGGIAIRRINQESYGEIISDKTSFSNKTPHPEPNPAPNRPSTPGPRPVDYSETPNPSPEYFEPRPISPFSS